MEVVDVKQANRWATKDGCYYFEKKLSQGSFGTVMQALRRNQIAEVKLFIHLVRLPGGGTLKLSNAKGLGALKHNSLLRVFELYECYEEKPTKMALQIHSAPPPEAIGIVCEYCPSGNLVDYLRSYRLGERTRLRWYEDLAQGLAYLHQQGLLHWELHPGNVWIKDDQLKLAGAGLGSVCWEHERRNKASSFAYTQNYAQYVSELQSCKPYLPPEVWRGRYDVYSEIFSLGMLYLLLSEAPDEGCHYAKWANETEFVGVLLHRCLPARTVNPTHLLSPPVSYARTQEVKLFNQMLQFESSARPSIDVVLKAVQDIVPMKYANGGPSLSTSTAQKWGQWLCSC